MKANPNKPNSERDDGFSAYYTRDCHAVSISVVAWVNIATVSGNWTSILIKGDTAWRLSTARDERKFHFAIMPGAAGHYIKQWGGINRKKTGRILQGKTWDNYPKLVSRIILGRADSLG